MCGNAIITNTLYVMNERTFEFQIIFKTTLPIGKTIGSVKAKIGKLNNSQDRIRYSTCVQVIV
jgi:hypothetical protein